MSVNIKNIEQCKNKTLGSNKVNAIIDNIEYKNITPKIILNEQIFSDIRGKIEYKKKEAIYPGINVIDIDWNGAIVGDNILNNTSDLLRLLSNIQQNSDTYWEDVITIKSNYKMYYTDSDNNILTNYTASSAYFLLINENIAPSEAKYVAIYDENDKYLYSLPLVNEYFNLTTDCYQDSYYTVGLLSDIHHDDNCVGENHIACNSNNNFLEYEDLEHALKVFKTKGVEFVACAGDITSNNIEQAKSFREHINSFYDKPIYTCKGNHDNAASYQHESEWFNYTNNYKNDVNNLTLFNSDNSSFYYEYNGDIYIYVNLDYNNSGYTALTHLTKEQYDFDNIETSYQFYNPDTIKELHNILNTNRNNRCFVFTHHPFVQKAGNPLFSYINDDCVTNRNYNYLLSGFQFALLNELHNYYKNSIWFSGHTHYQWKWQSNSNKANVCNWDILNDDYNYNNYNDYMKNKFNNYNDNFNEFVKKSAYAVHLPSVSRPMRPEKLFPTYKYSVGKNTIVVEPASEGAIMNVYENGVNIQGIIFSDETCKVNTVYNTKYITDKTQITEYDIDYDILAPGFKQNDQRVSTTEDGYIRLTFGTGNKKCGQRYYIFNTPSSFIKIDDIKIYNSNGQNITAKLLSDENPLVGLLGTDGIYHLDAAVTMNEVGYGYIFALDNEFLTAENHNEYNTLPLVIDVKMSSGVLQGNSVHKNTEYIDKYCSDANYWIPVSRTAKDIIESKTYSYFEEYIQKFNK